MEFPALLGSSNAAKGGLALLTICVVASAAMVRNTVVPKTPVSTTAVPSLAGLIRPGDVTSVTTPIALTVTDVLVRVGDEVTAGQPLLRVDHAGSQHDADQIGVELERAKQDVAEKEHTVSRTRQSIAHLKATIESSAAVAAAEREAQQVPTRQVKDSPERAKVALDQAYARLQRAQQLFNAGLVSRQDLDDASFTYRLAGDDVTNAVRAAETSDRVRSAQEADAKTRRNLSIAEAEQQLAVQEAAAEQARLALKQVRMRYDDATSRLNDVFIRAPRAGIVAELPANAGDRVVAGALVSRLASIDPLEVDIDVLPVVANTLTLGATVRVDIPALSMSNLPATVRAIAPLPGDSGKYAVQLALPNPNRARLAGLGADVTLSANTTRRP